MGQWLVFLLPHGTSPRKQTYITAWIHPRSQPIPQYVGRIIIDLNFPFLYPETILFLPQLLKCIFRTEREVGTNFTDSPVPVLCHPTSLY